MSKKYSSTAHPIHSQGQKSTKSSLRSLAELTKQQKTSSQQTQAPIQKKTPSQRQLSDTEYFRQSIGTVQPIQSSERTVPFIQSPKPYPLNHKQHDQEQEIHISQVSDEFEPSHLFNDDQSHYLRPGVQIQTLKKLRHKKLKVDATLDLHGFTQIEARTLLFQFILNACENHYRYLKIIHGKGLGSKDQRPILKNIVKRWLVQQQNVIAFCHASQYDGGSGALIVLLKTQPSQPE